MNPENRGFSNFEEEKQNNAENKEKKEQISLSFASAADLVRQIKSGERLKLTDYQTCSEYAVIFNKTTNQYDTWDIEGDGFSGFLDELPEYYEATGEKAMKIFFCGNQYDIPLWMLRPEAEPDEGANWDYLTPDGIHYRTKKNLEKSDENQKVRSRIEIKYLDEKPLSFEEIQEKIEQIKKKSNGHERFSDYWEFPERPKY